MFPVVHSPIKSNGIKYTLHHLQPQRITLEGHGRDRATITIRISYHSHVYSIADQDSPSAHKFSDESGKQRYFCEQRYGHSLTLPDICKAMIEDNFPTWVSQDRNTRNNMIVTELNPKDGLQYVVLYSLTPSLGHNVDVELVVKSAYEKHMRYIRELKKFGVRQLVKKCYFEGKPIPK
jgi:hypothetical protein